jgi:hypothetical protein
LSNLHFLYTQNIVFTILHIIAHIYVHTSASTSTIIHYWSMQRSSILLSLNMQNSMNSSHICLIRTVQLVKFGHFFHTTSHMKFNIPVSTNIIYHPLTSFLQIICYTLSNLPNQNALPKTTNTNIHQTNSHGTES